MAVFLGSFVLVAFGIVFQGLVFVAALVLLAWGLLTIGRPTLSPGRLVVWLALFLGVLAVSTIQIAGFKSVNYVADQLMLAGRTDGDMLMHAAVGNALRYYQSPAPASMACASAPITSASTRSRPCSLAVRASTSCCR